MSKTVLIVDDFESLRYVTKLPFESSGFHVITAADGQEALHKLQSTSNPVDLVVTDYHMPNMNGIELIKAIRGDVKYKYTPVIMLTTEMQDEVKKTAKKAGVTAWVNKPYKLEDFMSIVNRVLK